MHAPGIREFPFCGPTHVTWSGIRMFNGNSRVLWDTQRRPFSGQSYSSNVPVVLVVARDRSCSCHFHIATSGLDVTVGIKTNSSSSSSSRSSDCHYFGRRVDAGAAPTRNADDVQWGNNVRCRFYALSGCWPATPPSLGSTRIHRIGWAEID